MGNAEVRPRRRTGALTLTATVSLAAATVARLLVMSAARMRTTTSSLVTDHVVVTRAQLQEANAAKWGISQSGIRSPLRQNAEARATQVHTSRQGTSLSVRLSVVLFHPKAMPQVLV